MNLDLLSDAVRENLTDLLDKFELDYTDMRSKIVMPCPIHGGDNNTAVSIFIGDKAYVPNWKCYTNGCEKTYGSGIFSFFKALLEITNDTKYTEAQAIKWLKKELKFSEKSVNISLNEDYLEKKGFVNQSKILLQQRTIVSPLLTREAIRKKIIIPCTYFLDRNFSREILDKYDVGFCNKKGKEMSYRAIVPIYNDDYTGMVGCIGRTVLSQCSKCKYYHTDKYPCPEGYLRSGFVKWKMSSGFNAESYLYNYWFAKEHIINTNTAILVEGCGDVWRLEEAGIKNSVAIFGTSLSIQQSGLLDKAEVFNLILLLDNDDAGNKAEEKIISEYGHMYNIYTLHQKEYSDIGECSIDVIKEIISSFKNCKLSLL